MPAAGLLDLLTSWPRLSTGFMLGLRLDFLQVTIGVLSIIKIKTVLSRPIYTPGATPRLYFMVYCSEI